MARIPEKLEEAGGWGCCGRKVGSGKGGGRPMLEVKWWQATWTGSDGSVVSVRGGGCRRPGRLGGMGLDAW